MINPEKIGLNFIRPDVNRPGNRDFIESGSWLVSQYAKLGLIWNRLAFSWVLIEPKKGEFNWAPYDRIVEECRDAGIKLLATVGGHFDEPPVPDWAGKSLAEVVRNNSGYLENFVRAMVDRYRGRIRYWEILNEPRTFHKGLTVAEYVEKILKPGYRIIKGMDPTLRVLPCAFDQLPAEGDRGKFWDLARGHWDIQNMHHYADWGKLRRKTSADTEEKAVRDFRATMDKNGEKDKLFWVTEIGWWGTCSLHGIRKEYRKDPGTGEKFKEAYTGREILDHPTVLREDALRAEWMKEAFPRLLAVPGCEKLFLWTSMDEFEGGFNAERSYGEGASQVDLWGVIAGDRQWRKSAHVLKSLIGVESGDKKA